MSSILNTLRLRRNEQHFADDIFKRMFSMKMFEFRLKFHWRLFPRVQLTIFQHWFRWWLGAGQATSHYLNQWWLVYRRIYASLGLNELRHTAITEAEYKWGFEPTKDTPYPALTVELWDVFFENREWLHTDDNFTTGCNTSCWCDNFQCSRWWSFIGLYLSAPSVKNIHKDW